MKKNELIPVINHGKKGRPKKDKVEPVKVVAPTLTLLDVNRELYKKSYYEFYKAAFHVLEPTTTFEDNFHIKLICDTIQSEVERIVAGLPKSTDIIINVPFRSSKTLVANVCPTAWVWANYPSFRFITASYSASLALSNSTQSRDLIESDWYQQLYPHVQLKYDNNAKTEFENTNTGKRITTSVGGTVTGKGADMIIIDDPIKPADATSAIKLNECKEWYDGTISNRLNNVNVGVRIIIMQRLAEEDLCGYLLKKSPHRWLHICIPATDSDRSNIKPASLHQFYQDGLFWKKRFNREALFNYLDDLGSRGYANQLEQKALPAGGGMFKRDWFNIISQDDFKTKCNGRSIDWKFYLDTAETDKAHNDPSGILMVASFDNQLYIMDATAVRKQFTDLVKYVQQHVARLGHQESQLLIEGKSSGKSLLSQLRSETKFRLKELTTGTSSKAARAEASTPFCESGRVHLIKGSWNEGFIDQVTSFTNGKTGHDEFVDLLAYAVKDCKAGDVWFSFV